MRDDAPEVMVKEAAELLSAVATSDLASLPGGVLEALTLATHTAATVAAAAHTSVVAALDRSRSWEVDGARSAAAWVAWRCRIPAGRARDTVRCGRELRDLPATEAAFLAGQITAEHVRVLASAHVVNEAAFAECETSLVELAESLLFRSFQVAIRYWCQLNDPEGSERDATDRYRRRRLHCSSTFEGMVVLDGLFDPVSGEIVRRELERLEQQMYEHDRAEARERLGDAATIADLSRSPSQRRADALVEMAKRSASLPDGSGQARPLVSVLLGEASLAHVCELSSGDVVTPGEVLPLLRDADIEPVVFDGPSRVLDVGVRQRLFVGATRRAVELRDRQCVHPSCDMPAERCDVHHILPYDDDGPTVQSNGECRCRFHHRWHHRRAQPAS
jgi:hypothetical protein